MTTSIQYMPQLHTDGLANSFFHNAVNSRTHILLLLLSGLAIYCIEKYEPHRGYFKKYYRNLKIINSK